MKFVGIDFETTGLDLKTIRVVEIGAVVYDETMSHVVNTFGCLVFDPSYDYKQMSPEALATHGIDVATLERFGLHPREAFNILRNLIAGSVACVAHNGTNYDKPLLAIEMERNGIQYEPGVWIDTAQDVPYPEKMASRRLVHLAAEHGILNPFAHRAVCDVMTMMRMLAMYPIQEVLRNATTPTIRLRALVQYEQRELAKARRFRWDGDKKWWVKDIKEFNVEKEINEAPFQVVEIPMEDKHVGIKKEGPEKGGEVGGEKVREVGGKAVDSGEKAVGEIVGQGGPEKDGS